MTTADDGLKNSIPQSQAPCSKRCTVIGKRTTGALPASPGETLVVSRVPETAVSFERSDPTRVLARCDTPIFVPERPWEIAGQVPNVVFVEGLVREGPRWLFYYGAADTRVGVAEAFTRKESR